MLELLVSESVMKTDYVKKLIRYKVRNVKIGDTINVEILGVEDEKLGIINLYFDIQDDLESIYNTDEDFSSISMHSLFKIIHNFFYDTDTLPFEVVVFLIKQGYKKEFISDIYYEALLYETKEIYDNIMEENKYRNNSELECPLIHYHENNLTIKKDNYNKYNDYCMSLKSISMNFSYNHSINIVRPSVNVQSYNAICRALFNDYNFMLEILLIGGVALCGGFVNSLILDEKYGDIDIFFYGENNSDDEILEKIEKIITYITNEDGLAEVLQTSNSITICTRHSRNIQIVKRVYKNISEILLGFDVDSCACSIYYTNDKIYVSYLPRYKFAVEHGINIINPRRQSKTYNRRLVKYNERGFNIFVPGKVHTVGNYVKLENKQIEKNTFTILLYYLLLFNFKGNSVFISGGSTDLVKYKEETVSDYDYKKIPRRIFYVYADYEGDALSREQIEYLLIQSSILENRFDIYITAERFCVRIDETSGLNLVHLHDVLVNTKVNKNWMRHNPGTQVSGSFNPTNVDYLAVPKESDVDNNFIKNFKDYVVVNEGKQFSISDSSTINNLVPRDIKL